MSRSDALRKAYDLGVDLVEVAGKANPPVCRLIEFKKFKYLESKKERLERKKSKESETKEIRLGPFTGKHDQEVRIARAREFLKKGNKVRVTVKFTGRQFGKKEFGFQLIQGIIENLKEYSKIDREPNFEGPVLAAILSPIKQERKQNAKSQNQDSNQEAV